MRPLVITRYHNGRSYEYLNYKGPKKDHPRIIEEGRYVYR